MEYIKQDTELDSKVVKLFYDGGEIGNMAAALDNVCNTAEELVRQGSQCIVLSDKPESGGNGASLTANRPTVPTLLAVGAVHHHLI